MPGSIGTRLQPASTINAESVYAYDTNVTRDTNDDPAKRARFQCKQFLIS